MINSRTQGMLPRIAAYAVEKNCLESVSRFLLGLIAVTGISTSCFAADAASGLPIAVDTIKDGDVVFFRSDAPIAKRVFDLATPIDSPEVSALRKMAAEDVALAETAKADAASKMLVQKIAETDAAAAAKAAGAPDATPALKALAAAAAKAALQAAADAKTATDASNTAAALAAAATAALKSSTGASNSATTVSSRGPTQTADDAAAAKAAASARDLILKFAVANLAASSKAAGDPGAAAAASAATQATSDAKAAAEESAQAAANAAGLATSVATPASATLCIPMYSRFHVESVVAGTTTPKTGAADAKNAGAKTTNSADNKSETAAANSQIIKGSFSSKAHLFHKSALPFAPVEAKRSMLWHIRNALSFGTLPEKSDKKVTCNGSFDPDTIVDYDIPYEFTSDDFQKVRSQRMGFTWGGLVVPYKFYVSDRSFQTNTSTVGYVGYEGYFPGVSLAGIVALGPGFASTNQIQPAATPGGTPTTKTTTSATYTAATGLVTTFGGVMKLGLVVGWDWQGRAVGFKYEGKTWVAVSIGAGF